MPKENAFDCGRQIYVEVSPFSCLVLAMRCTWLKLTLFYLITAFGTRLYAFTTCEPVLERLCHCRCTPQSLLVFTT